VPFISASPIAIPNVFTVSAHAMRLVGSNYSRIVDASDPGGSGNIYDGFDEEQKQALREVTQMGLAPQSWFRYLRTSLSYTAVFAQLLDGVYRLDPTYFTDLWTKPGYFGANTTKSLLKARIQHTTTIKRMLTAKQLAAIGLDFYPMPDNIKNETDAAPVAIQLASYPEGDLSGATIKLTSGPAAGNWVYTLVMYKNVAVITYGENNSPDLGKMKEGDQVLVDNSIYLASQTYHRHKNPGQEYQVWNQFRKPDGSNMYPQRPLLADHYNQLSGTGTIQDGNFSAKMILVESAMDEIAFPWQAEWYRKQVGKHAEKGIDEKFRIYMVDKSMHTPPDRMTPWIIPAENTRIVSYIPVIQQALRDLTQWCEKGIPPPQSTNFAVVDGQIQMPDSAAERKGIQPVVNLVANGGEVATIKRGESVQFVGQVEVPPDAGKVVAAEFDFNGLGTYPVSGEIQSVNETAVIIKANQSFWIRGTYFPALRVYSQRPADQFTIDTKTSENYSSKYGRVHNLGRVRVVVE
jgi:hypothetical protein